MGLTTPELDLLREALAEDPSDPIFVEVARELINRQEWGDAVSVLQAGVHVDAEREEAWQLLAEAAYIDGQYDRVLAAVRQLEPDPVTNPHLSRLEIQSLEMLRRLEDARTAVTAFLEVHPTDPLILDASARLTSAGPAPGLTALDRFYTIERAEAYAAMGRHDRAFRVLRRVQFHHPDDLWLNARLQELRHGPFEAEDDLSEDLGEVLEPPVLSVPTPGLAVSTLDADAIAELSEEAMSKLSSDDLAALADEENTDYGDTGNSVRLRDEDEQETQPALLPSDQRAMILEEAGAAGDHVGGGLIIEDLTEEDDPTEESEARPGTGIETSEFENLDPEAFSEEVGDYLGRGRRRRRRSLIK